MAVATLGALVAASGCGDDSSGENRNTTDSTESPEDSPPDFDGLSEDAVITYEYQDSSVPPEYHRSYSLTISHAEVEVVVDSYGDVIGETTAPIPVDVWDGLSTGAAEVVSLEPDDIDQEGCSGGTGRSLVIEDGGETLMDLEIYLCAGDANAAQAEVIDGYVEPVIDAIPDWDSLFETE